ncbi:MAG: hypothetical protein RRB13_01515 [bacterium]|nr:hypothetical protein [bacterium]
MRPARFLTLLLALMLLATPLWADVIGKGSAEIFNGNEGAARSQAKRNALRDAVEKGVGTLIDANTRVENWQVIRDEVYTSAQGFVSSYKTLKDAKEGTSWVVEIDAVVSTEMLKDKLGELRILHKKMGNKRLLVIYRAEDDKALEDDHPAVNAAQGEIQSLLNDAGFRVFDAKSVDRIKAMRRGEAVRGMEEWMKIAAEQQADILAEFELSTNLGTRGAFEVQAAKVAMKMRVYDVSTGRLIATQFAEQKQLTNARPGSFDWRSALSGAAQKAADQATGEGIQNIVKFYQKVGDLGNGFYMRFTGFSEDEEDQILAVLENLDGYQSLSELKNDTETIEIEYFSSLQKSQLRRKLKLKAKEKGVRIKSQEVSGNRFDFVKQY